MAATKEYCFIELITGLKPTQRGIECIWEAEKSKQLLNDKGKDGWRFVGLLPDEKGTAIMERDINVPDDYILKELQCINQRLSKPWYKFW